MQLCSLLFHLQKQVLRLLKLRVFILKLLILLKNSLLQMFYLGVLFFEPLLKVALFLLFLPLLLISGA